MPFAVEACVPIAGQTIPHRRYMFVLSIYIFAATPSPHTIAV